MWSLGIATLALDHLFRTTIFKAFGKQGNADKALELFQQMREQGIIPDQKIWSIATCIRLLTE